MSRLDARAKATGTTTYAADVGLADMAHVAVTRATRPHARIVSIDTKEALAVAGVIGVFTAADVAAATYGRAVADSPILARDKVRFVGERVAAVVAETRKAAEEAAALVEVTYEPLLEVTSGPEAVADGAPLVHDAPWQYPGAAVTPEAGHNLQYATEIGSLERTEAALAAAAHRIDCCYRTPPVHQGYLEPQACVADYGSGDKIRVWMTNKSPYLARNQIGSCLQLAPESIDLQPVALGGDFGGKGSPGDAPLCIELSRLTGRPVKLVLRYSEDLTATNPRHTSQIRVRAGCDGDGRLVAMALYVVLNGGAYAGFTPNASGPRGAYEVNSYRIPNFYADVKRAYTNSVPRGNMRAPGAPQGIFAVESAMDELALVAGLDPAEFRRRNLLEDREAPPNGHGWVENRGKSVLETAMAALSPVSAPPGWLRGRGVAVYCRGTHNTAVTSIRLSPIGERGVRVEIPVPETGTGSHTVVRELVAEALSFDSENVEVVQVATDELVTDFGAGGGRVTSTMAFAVDAAAKAWQNRQENESVLVEVDEDSGPHVGSYVAQVAQVAVDPDTGELRVLELLSAVDVANIINDKAHRMQIDGAAAMGFGFGCLEDLVEEDGQMWAANLGEFKIPSARDVPALRTVLVTGGLGLGSANVKNIGELCNPPTAAAIANAVAAATGCRIRELPLTAERIYRALREKESSG